MGAGIRGEAGSLLNIYECGLRKEREIIKDRLWDNRLRPGWFSLLSGFVFPERLVDRPQGHRYASPCPCLWICSDRSPCSCLSLLAMEYISYLVRCDTGRMNRKGTQQQKMRRRDDWKEHI